MTVEFYKYQGTGNDFVMIDNRKGSLDRNDLSLAKNLCNRRFGIGADGLILIENHSELDFEMVYFNTDGTQSFCGNGSRCAVSFAHFLGVFSGNNTSFLAIDGVHEANFKGDSVELKMGNVNSVEKGESHFFIDTGSPHYISYCENVEKVNLVPEAQSIRYNDRFKDKGTNVNFVEKQSERLKMRTYERGVEGETLSCGTGATAVALSGAIQYGMDSPIAIKVPGGELAIKFKQISHNQFEDIWLIGPAVQVFKGVVEV